MEWKTHLPRASPRGFSNLSVTFDLTPGRQWLIVFDSSSHQNFILHEKKWSKYSPYEEIHSSSEESPSSRTLRAIYKTKSVYVTYAFNQNLSLPAIFDGREKQLRSASSWVATVLAGEDHFSSEEDIFGGDDVKTDKASHRYLGVAGGLLGAWVWESDFSIIGGFQGGVVRSQTEFFDSQANSKSMEWGGLGLVTFGIAYQTDMITTSLSGIGHSFNVKNHHQNMNRNLSHVKFQLAYRF